MDPIDPKAAAAVLALVDEQEVVDLALTLANIAVAVFWSPAHT